VIPLNESHLRRLVRDYVAYFQDNICVLDEASGGATTAAIAEVVMRRHDLGAELERSGIPQPRPL